MKEPIYFYSSTEEWFELSNFYPQGFVDDDGLYWPSIEHYFQAMKFPGEQYYEYREQIRYAQSPARAKKLGQTRTYPIRPDWQEVKEEIMLYALRKKFSHPKMQVKLLQTRERPLYENSPHDEYWGIGKQKQGKNRLGELLMQVRAELFKSIEQFN